MEINNISTSIDLQGYERSIVELVNNEGGTTLVEIEKNQLSATNKRVYDNYVNVFAEISQTRIINTPEVFFVTRMTSDVIIENTIEIDFETLSNDAKTSIDEFYKMVLSLNN